MRNIVKIKEALKLLCMHTGAGANPADYIDELQDLFDPSTGHDHDGTGDRGPKVPEANVVFSAIGHAHGGSTDGKNVPEASVVFDGTGGHTHGGTTSGKNIPEANVVF